MIPRTREDKRNVWLGGVVAGLIGGVVISIFMLVQNLVQGNDIWVGMKVAGAPFLGDRAFEPGFAAGPVMVGVLSHFAVSVAWGVLFALLFYGITKGLTVLAGAFWGILVWLGMFHVVLPLLGLGGMVANAPVLIAIVEHVLFGLGVGVGFLPYQRPRRATYVARTTGAP
jgi:hypothetical protein